MIISGELTGSQVINLLYDQGILNMATDEDYSDYKAGSIKSFDFMCKKIEQYEHNSCHAGTGVSMFRFQFVVTDPNSGAVKAMRQTIQVMITI